MNEPLRVLLVEDNPGDARLLREMVSELVPRIELTHVSRLADGIEALGRTAFDVLLLDLSLPDATGSTTIARASDAAPTVPIIVMTGLDDAEVAGAAMRRGAQDYLVKGEVTPSLLARSIRYAVDRKRAEEAAQTLLRERIARATAEQSVARWKLLAEVSEELSRSFDLATSLRAATRHLVPAIADVCTIDVEDEGRTERVIELAVPRDDLPHASAPDRHLQVAIIGTNRTLGTMSFRRHPSRVSWSDEELRLAAELGRRVGMAIENIRLYRAREDVIGIVSHDLRNPLNLIALSLPLLEREERADLRAQQAVRARRALERVNRLIADLLDVTRIEANALSVMRQPIDVASLLSEAVEVFRPLAEEKQIHLRSGTFDGSKPGPADAQRESALPDVSADRERLLQVFGNLIANALKFTPPGGEIFLEASCDGGEIRFAVRDTGAGICPEELPHVFDRFWQGARQTRTGAGLGLAIVRGIIHAHGGRIGVESRLGAGSAFWFTIPLVEAATGRRHERLRLA